MLSILFLKVEIENKFVFPKIMLHETSYTKLLLYGRKFTTQAENRRPNGN